jgi:hypothetical protein
VGALVLRAERGTTPLGAIFALVGLLACLAIGLLGLDRLPVQLCVFKALTGRPCLTCGATRALGRLYALDLRGALLMNPLATVGALTLLAWGLADLALLPLGRALSLRVSPGAGRVLRIGAVSLVLLNWAYLLAVGR